jgi:hypothetical protein
MSGDPAERIEPAGDNGHGSLDHTLEIILERFVESRRLDRAHEDLRAALHRRFETADFSPWERRILEVNLFGSLSGWMDFLVKERQAGRDAVPDFARHLRRAFLAHCREGSLDPGEAVGMAVALAQEIMQIAVGFRRHLGLTGEEMEETGPATGPLAPPPAGD